MTVFEAYITNLGKYAEGQLVGETLKFPATTEEVQSLLKNIGVDGVRYEEFFITAFDGDVMGLYDYLTEYENLDELNHLAHLISELDSDEIETLEAVLNKGDHRQPRFSHLAGDGGCDHCGAVAVAHVVLQNEYRTDTTLLRPDDWPQVSIVNVTTADFLSTICFHRIHLLSILGLIS